MATTTPGGRYQTATGDLVNADGKPIGKKGAVSNAAPVVEPTVHPGHAGPLTAGELTPAGTDEPTGGPKDAAEVLEQREAREASAAKASDKAARATHAVPRGGKK